MAKENKVSITDVNFVSSMNGLAAPFTTVVSASSDNTHIYRRYAYIQQPEDARRPASILRDSHPFASYLRIKEEENMNAYIEAHYKPLTAFGYLSSRIMHRSNSVTAESSNGYYIDYAFDSGFGLTKNGYGDELVVKSSTPWFKFAPPIICACVCRDYEFITGNQDSEKDEATEYFSLIGLTAPEQAIVNLMDAIYTKASNGTIESTFTSTIGEASLCSGSLESFSCFRAGSATVKFTGMANQISTATKLENVPLIIHPALVTMAIICAQSESKEKPSTIVAKSKVDLQDVTVNWPKRKETYTYVPFEKERSFLYKLGVGGLSALAGFCTGAVAKKVACSKSEKEERQNQQIVIINEKGSRYAD